ncbi:bifunctional homocysteine S-methyltransferase/methylenetetrahydrofolate reductase [Ligaoa zhengdingensis]|uniref:bifunctional homocysteine S-methyltransferase/methylenetetrahydrofolate reductase n=1 Tax=Ligaoa zhengdingensis TaxID=2763658 RepID=UPI0031B9D194
MDIRTYFAQGAPLLFDGAMGTYFASQPGRAEERCERACLTRPEEILHIHRAYLEAGCRAIKTNTFSVSADLADGMDETARDIVDAACRLALQAAASYGAYVFADLGPAPLDRSRTPAEVYQTQAQWFLDLGVTHFVAETLSDDEGIREFAHWLKKQCPEAFLMVSFAVGHDGLTRAGRLGGDLYRRTAQITEVDAVGFNCVSGPHHLLEYIKTLELSGKPLAVMPNAGYPTVLGRRTVFQGQPDYFAGQMVQIVRAGASIVGGCCGTTPEHIAQTAQALEKPLPKACPAAPEKRPKLTMDVSNSLWEKLKAGKHVITVELDPPADDNSEGFLEDVQALRDAGADTVTIADCPIGRPRADSSLLACKIKRELGMEPLPHLTCRDRNMNATKALLLGLSMEGVHNVLLVTGDPIPTEDRDEVKSVFNFNSRKLARFVSVLNESTLRASMRIYGALNLNARNFEVELRRAQEKEECGVTGFLTQPVLSAEALDNLKLAHATLQGKILGGIFPVVSHRNACFLNNEIAGMRVCDEIVALYEGKDRDAAEDLAVTISTRIAKEIFPYTDGFYLMTPFRRVALMERIIKNIQR